MLVDKQSELMSDLLFTVHQHGGDDVTWKPPINPSIKQVGIPPFYDDEHCNFQYLLWMGKIRKDRHQGHIHLM